MNAQQVSGLFWDCSKCGKRYDYRVHAEQCCDYAKDKNSIKISEMKDAEIIWKMLINLDDDFNRTRRILNRIVRVR